jgi:hypothetical protein
MFLLYSQLHTFNHRALTLRADLLRSLKRYERQLEVM